MLFHDWPLNGEVESIEKERTCGAGSKLALVEFAPK
jgi:hypothetical protein